MDRSCAEVGVEMGPRKEASNHYHLVIETPDGVRDRRDRVYRKSERSGHLTLWARLTASARGTAISSSRPSGKPPLGWSRVRVRPFQRDPPLQFRVLGLPDDAHPTFANLLDPAVGSLAIQPRWPLRLSSGLSRSAGRSLRDASPSRQPEPIRPTGSASPWASGRVVVVTSVRS